MLGVLHRTAKPNDCSLWDDIRGNDRAARHSLSWRTYRRDRLAGAPFSYAANSHRLYEISPDKDRPKSSRAIGQRL
jgi:hypothetical protein